jgi:tryptophanyl-tRNA synthetase
MALDDPTQKMSKSAERPGSVVQLVDPPDAIVKKVRSAVTDSGREIRAAEDKPALSNLLAIYSLIEGVPVSELEERFSGEGYGAFKQALAEALVEGLRPLRERFEELTTDLGEVRRLMLEGARSASAVAEETMADVRARCGLASP